MGGAKGAGEVPEAAEGLAVGALCVDREERHPGAAGFEVDVVAYGARHPGGLAPAATAGQEAGQEPWVDRLGVRADQEDRGGEVGTYVWAFGDARGQPSADRRHEDVALADHGVAHLVDDDPEQQKRWNPARALRDASSSPRRTRTCLGSELDHTRLVAG